MLIIEEVETGIEYVLESYTRAQLLDMLKDQPVLVSFKKATNNRYRLLFGTRDISRVPPGDHPTGAGLRFNPEEKDIIPIYDLVKQAWRSFKVKRVRKAEPKTDAFLRRLLKSKKLQDRIRLKKYKDDTSRPNDKNVKDYRDMASDIGVKSPPPPEEFTTEDKTMWDKMVDVWKLFKNGDMERGPFEQALSAFKNFLRVKKESTIHTVTAYEVPVLFEGNMKQELMEGAAWDRLYAWGERNYEKIVNAAEMIMEFLRGEMANFKKAVPKIKDHAEFLINFIKKVVLGRPVSNEEKSLALEVFKEFMKYVGLGIVFMLPTTPPGSVAIVYFLKWIQDKTGLPVFPKSWEEEPVDTRKRLGFKEALQEMAAGAVGGGASTKNNSTIFRQNAQQAIGRINNSMSSGMKLNRLGKTSGGIAYYIGNSWSGDVIVSTHTGPDYEVADDLDSVTFVARLYGEEHIEINAMETMSVQHPFVKPELAGRGIAAEVYALLAREFNIVADNTQSKEGRFLWAKLVRDKSFRFVYVYNESVEEIEEEINGDLNRFRELMAQGDDETRFIGTSMKSA
jgi:G:T-mismatch repair DNA endonuclease (very short patch repair protein)